MRSALFTLLVAAAMTSASASTPPAPAPDPAFIKPPPGPLSTLAQEDHRGQRINTSAPLHAAAIQTVAMTPGTGEIGQADSQAGGPQEDAGWQGFAPVAVTLALLGAIAVRRHRAGKS